MQNKKIILVAFLVTLLFLAASAVILYLAVFGSNLKLNKEQDAIEIASPTSLDSLMNTPYFRNALKNPSTLNLTAKLKRYSKPIKAGRYLMQNGMSNNDLINLLRSGIQEPVIITFNNIRTKEELAGNLAGQLMIDSTDIVSLLNNSTFLTRHNLNTHTSLSPFLPDSYEMYWTTTPEALFDRMLKETERFWNTSRQEKAKFINLSFIEVVILASIVNEESNFEAEQPIIAGVYLNRLKRGYLLQADPTLKFALNDFGKKRLLNADKLIDSPYNTYKYKGLPPGPIRIPSKTAIDAVLNPKKHNYLYMCAKADFSGEHHFSETLTEHLRYAKEYQRKLNQLRIYK